MKGQVMADFVLEYSRRPSQHHESSKQEWWTLRVDGASRSSGSGVGLLLQSPTGEHLEQAIRLGFSASNNEAEYEAILSGLDLALALSVSKLRIYSDSQLVQFTEWTIEKIKRADNRRADALAGIAASLPIKEAILLPYIIYPDRNSTRRSQTGTQSPGASCPFHLNWGAPVQAILHRTLPSVPRAFRGPVCSHSTYAINNVKINLRPMALRTMGHGHSGTLPAAPAQKKFLLVATDYFTDNGPQFDSIAFRNFCSELNIRNSYSTPRYPQSNGQAEATNKTLITALKKRLEQAKGMGRGATRRPMGLPNYTRTANRKYSFRSRIWNGCSHSYEIGLPTIRTDAAKQSDANMELGRNLDWTDEVRESAAIRMADYQQRASAHYNRKVRPRSFKNANSRSSSLFVQPSAAKSSLCFFSINFCPELPHLPPQRAISSAASCSGRPLIPPSLPQPNPPGGLHSFRMVDKLASASSSLRRNWFPPDEAAEGDFVPDEGPQHLRPDGSPGATSAGTTTGTAGVSVTISTSPPPDERRGQMSN
ncbi:hypothetical protein CK203_115310 [Vitis vinifera]|uniref:Integrase catalytic domain-containing protein n=1 Tax=Vitis vinifera TaxID=29760 RepID=A0A438C407_VITVI|nr:hypothetical protein CK203_115310 [Vitis vinifera]